MKIALSSKKKSQCLIWNFDQVKRSNRICFFFYTRKRYNKDCFRRLYHWLLKIFFSYKFFPYPHHLDGVHMVFVYHCSLSRPRTFLLVSPFFVKKLKDFTVTLYIQVCCTYKSAVTFSFNRRFSRE